MGPKGRLGNLEFSRARWLTIRNVVACEALRRRKRFRNFLLFIIISICISFLRVLSLDSLRLCLLLGKSLIIAVLELHRRCDLTLPKLSIINYSRHDPNFPRHDSSADRGQTTVAHYETILSLQKRISQFAYQTDSLAKLLRLIGNGL